MGGNICAPDRNQINNDDPLFPAYGEDEGKKDIEHHHPIKCSNEDMQ